MAFTHQCFTSTGGLRNGLDRSMDYLNNVLYGLFLQILLMWVPSVIFYLTSDQLGSEAAELTKYLKTQSKYLSVFKVIYWDLIEFLHPTFVLGFLAFISILLEDSPQSFGWYCLVRSEKYFPASGKCIVESLIGECSLPENLHKQIFVRINIFVCYVLLVVAALNNLFKILLVFKTVRNWKISQLIPIEVEKSSKLVSVLSYGEYRLLIHVLQRCGTDTRQCIISELFCHKVPNQYEV